MRNRVIVDENAGPNSAVWQEFQRALGERDWDFLFLGQTHPGIPDTEILDKLLGPDAILLTGDCVLHMRALERGIRSYTLNEQGQLTRRRLKNVRLTKREPQSVFQELQEQYVYRPTSHIPKRLKQRLTEKQFKRYRTARRRIRSHFGSAAAISQASITVGAKPTRSGLLCGFAIRLAGTSGVKGLMATEGYCHGHDAVKDSACPVLHALRDLYLLQLDQVRIELFVAFPPSIELTRRLLEGDAVPQEPTKAALQRLLKDLARLTVQPCVKGFFYDSINRKLDRLAHRRSNEVTQLDFSQIAADLLRPADTFSEEMAAPESLPELRG